MQHRRTGRTSADRAAEPPSGRATHSHRARPPARRPGLYLGVAAAGAMMVDILVGVEPAAQAVAGDSRSVEVAQQLGLTARSGPVDVAEDLQPLEDLAASRSTREYERSAAQQAQVAADGAERDRRKAEAEEEAEAEAAAAAAAAAKAEAEAAAKAKATSEAKAEAEAQVEAAAPAAPEAAQEAAAEQDDAEEAPAAEPRPAPAAEPRPAPAAGAIADISNSAGPVHPNVQAAADAVVSNVPGAGSITLGGTRPSAADPGGHPSGLALDYMVMSDSALGDAIVAYHLAHWNDLGVDYIIWEQRMLSSPSGSWRAMGDRGSRTANHMDHPHVNYLG